MNTAMPIESEEINGIESEESFSEKEHIRLVKEYARAYETVDNGGYIWYNKTSVAKRQLQNRFFTGGHFYEKRYYHKTRNRKGL